MNDTIGGLSTAATLGTTTDPGFENGKLVLTIHFNSGTTTAAVQSFLRGITFTTNRHGLKQPLRELSVQITDAAGAASAVLQQTVRVTK